MPIGDGPDYYNGIVPEEDRQIALQEKVDKWFRGLDESYQREILDGYYPDKAHLMNIEEMWNGLDWNAKWEIYRDEKDEIYP